MGLRFFKIAILVFIGVSTMISCEFEQEDRNIDISELIFENNHFNHLIDCPAYATNQVAQGFFLGESFVSPGGTYRDHSFGGEKEYLCKIYVTPTLEMEGYTSTVSEGDRDTILFSINSLEPQTFKVSQNFTSDDGELNKKLSFNRVTKKEAITISELSCGAVTITKYDENTGKLYGTVVAKGIGGSSVDGSFVLDFCKKSVF